MDEEVKQKISDTVMSILKDADMETMTEYKVRNQASEILSIDLSQPDPKKLVRHLVQSFLNANLPDNQPASEANDDDNKVDHPESMAAAAELESEPGDEPGDEPEKEEEEQEEGDNQRHKKAVVREYDDEGDLIACRLSDKRRVTVQDFKGKTLVSIREYYNKDGKELPSSKGISLTAEQWSTFKQSVPAIEQAIKKLESR